MASYIIIGIIILCFEGFVAYRLSESSSKREEAWMEMEFRRETEIIHNSEVK